MASTFDRANRVINGTFGSLLLDGVPKAEVKAGQVKIEKSNKEVPLAGRIVADTKLTKVKVQVSLTLYHVDSFQADEIKNTLAGKDVRHTAILALEDPDAYGYERIAVRNITFDTLTAADWELDKFGEITLPGSATEVEFLDKIAVS